MSDHRLIIRLFVWLAVHFIMPVLFITYKTKVNVCLLFLIILSRAQNFFFGSAKTQKTEREARTDPPPGSGMGNEGLLRKSGYYIENVTFANLKSPTQTQKMKTWPAAIMSFYFI